MMVISAGSQTFKVGRGKDADQFQYEALGSATDRLRKCSESLNALSQFCICLHGNKYVHIS